VNGWQEAGLYARFALGLPRFLGRRMSAAEARATVADRLAARGENLLRLVRDAVFANPGSPYRPLFRLAGCELGDFERMLAAEGVERTLGALYDAGVRVTFDEFKGRTPIVRRGLELAVSESDFDAPALGAAFAGRSSGTSGRATRTYHDLGHLLDTVPFRLLGAEAHGLLTAPLALWLDEPPCVAGLNMALSSSVLGNPPERWWTPIEPAGFGRPLRLSWAFGAFFALAAAGGVRLPRPRALAFDAPDEIVDWLAAALARHGRCELRTFASSALRVARAAVRRGVDLSGAVLVCGGEATTPAKQAAVEASGARMVSFYAITEVGPVGMSCPHAADARDLHFAADRLAVVGRPVALPDFGIEVDALHLTALLPGGPKVMLNVESDDCGTVDTGGSHRCGCPLERAGLGTHLGNVRSYRRLTAEGVTLVPEGALRIVEELLPARFGGTPLDYQLGEAEGPDGTTRVTLRVDPTVALARPDEVAGCLLDALRAEPGATAIAAAFWRGAGTVELRRETPLRTPAGKLLPILPAGLATAGPRFVSAGDEARDGETALRASG
jgi:hypothetical protein